MLVACKKQKQFVPSLMFVEQTVLGTLNFVDWYFSKNKGGSWLCKWKWCRKHLWISKLSHIDLRAKQMKNERRDAETTAVQTNLRISSSFNSFSLKVLTAFKPEQILFLSDYCGGSCTVWPGREGNAGNSQKEDVCVSVTRPLCIVTDKETENQRKADDKYTSYAHNHIQQSD